MSKKITKITRRIVLHNVRGYPKFCRSEAQAKFVPNRRGARFYPPAPACSARSEQRERRGDRTEEARRADEADQPLLFDVLPPSCKTTCFLIITSIISQ